MRLLVFMECSLLAKRASAKCEGRILAKILPYQNEEVHFAGRMRFREMLRPNPRQDSSFSQRGRAFRQKNALPRAEINNFGSLQASKKSVHDVKERIQEGIAFLMAQRYETKCAVFTTMSKKIFVFLGSAARCSAAVENNLVEMIEGVKRGRKSYKMW